MGIWGYIHNSGGAGKRGDHVEGFPIKGLSTRRTDLPIYKSKYCSLGLGFRLQSQSNSSHSTFYCRCIRRPPHPAGSTLLLASYLHVPHWPDAGSAPQHANSRSRSHTTSCLICRTFNGSVDKADRTSRGLVVGHCTSSVLR